MSSVHFLNVGKGDCTLIRHNSGRNSLIDICKGNYQEPVGWTFFHEMFAGLDDIKPRLDGDFGMSKKPTNPLHYLKSIGVKSLFRFILTHPDMDHLDGFDRLLEEFKVSIFWDNGVKKEKPDFSKCREYEERDWDRYVEIRRENEPGVEVVHPLAGDYFKYANRTETGESGSDGLYILAPDKALVANANAGGDVNDGSYVLPYRSRGGRIVIPGDAHDETWDYVLSHYEADVANCSVLFAPHHGRKSGRSFDFLSVLRPKVTFFGCASSGHLAYSAWSSRGLPVITNNQAGNIVLECAERKIDVYVQNSEFAEARGCDIDSQNDQGYVLFDSISETTEVTR